jgi:hypothetical protein
LHGTRRHHWCGVRSRRRSAVNYVNYVGKGYFSGGASELVAAGCSTNAGH